MTLNINLTRRVRRRTRKDGQVVEQLRYVLNWRDPKTGAREQRFFERQKEAQEQRAELIAAFDKGTYSAHTPMLTVADTVASWLAAKQGTVRPHTHASYTFQARYVTGPLAPSEARKAQCRSGKGKLPPCQLMPLLGAFRVKELATRDIRVWHKTICDEVSVHAANKALMILKAALAMAAEDHEFRPPAMPTGLPKRSGKAPKEVLKAEDIQLVIAAASNDQARGIYYAAPFLMGTRPSEQLSLLWQEVDFEANVIRIRRVQLKDGSLSEMTKTAAGHRDIPMSPLLRSMLLEWRVRCPRRSGVLERVFPAPGRKASPLTQQPPTGGPLLYNNFRARIWAPVMRRLGLPAVTPHSARHSFISVLQAQGVEVAVVAKLAGHKNANVTLGHYTHAMRGGEAAVEMLDKAFGQKA